MKKIILIFCIASNIFAGIGNSELEKNLEGLWRGSVNGMQINLAIFAPGNNGNAYEFNATIEFNAYRGYVKEVLGETIKMNVNGKHSVWSIIENDKNKIVLYQSGFPMFPTMDEIVLEKKK